MRIFTLKHPGSALGRNLLLLVVCTLLSLSAYAEANYVYHEATTNNPGCGADNYRSLLAPTSAQTLKLAWKVEFQLYTDQTRVYYTTDGSTPSGVKGVPSGTTKVLTGAYSCTFGSPVVDVATATIPAQPAGTVVKYIIGAWHSGGGDEIFANGPGAPCGGCGTVTNSAALATLFTYTVTASTGVVEVYATGGTAYTAYTTVKAAFDAINAGTHTGAIQIAINANTSETATAVLNSSGAGAATYTSIKMFPTGDAVTVSGASATGRGLIELNGADNVTIDGDNPNTAGTNRNLTITNTASATTTYTMAIRIAIATSVVTTANNVTIKNCVVNGSATGRNASANTSTTGSENNTYGIYAGGGASTVSQTTAPAAISSTTTTVGSGGTFNGLIIQNNAVNKCARGIAVQGSTTSVCDNLQVKDNLIGNSTAGSTDQVYSMGMTLQGFSAATVSNNTVYVESFLGTTALRGIDLGSVSSSGTAAVVELNKVYRVNTRNTGTYGAYGINIAAGANQVIRNNFVMGVTNDMSGGIAFSTAAGTFGIRISASTGHKVYHNSVSLTGLRSGTAASSLLSAAFAITTTSVTGCDVRNNIFSNTQSGGTTSLAYVSMYLPSGGTSAMALTLNNNAYYSGSTAGSTGICHVGTTYGTANLYTAANFVAGATTPATNLRAYTSTLGVSTSDNASYASTNAAPYTNATTDLHLDMASSELTNVEQKGVSGLGVGTDIDANVRPNSGTTLPDMGADEVAQAACSSADGGTISPTTATVCAGGTYAMASTGATVGTGITYQWKVSTTSGSGYVNVSGGTGATTTSYTTGALSAGTYYYVLETTCTAGPVSDLSNELVVTVNSVPTVTASSNSPVCSGSDLLLTGNVTGTATSYVWSGPNSFSATTQNATILSAGITHSGTYTFTASNGSCPSAPSTTVVTVNPAPTAIVLTPTSVTRCLNDAASKLKATSSVSSTYTSGVGTSTTVGNTTLATLGPNPLQMYYGGTKQQMIYTAAELTSFGLVAGSKINSIEFNLVTANTTYSLDSLTVKMKNSASASFPTASSWESGMTTVRPVAAYSPVVGWNNIALTTPFTWDGTSNLVIEVNYSNNNTGGSTTFNTAKYSATGFVSTIFYRVDSKTATAVDAFTGTANYTYSQRNDLKFNITTPAAITWSPSAGLFTNSGATTAYSGSAIDSVWAAPTATTKYYVTATLGSCTKTDSVTVTVNSPTAPAVADAQVCPGSTTTLDAGSYASYSWSNGATSQTITVGAGSYSVTVTDSNGCTATDAANVTEYSSVTAPAVADAQVCPGGTTTLNAGSYTSYSWSNGSTSQTNTVGAGSYSVTVTDSNGCTATDAANVTEYSVTAPAVADAQVCPGGTTTLNAGSYTSYSWSNGSTSQTNTVGVGSYSVTVTDSNGCTATDAASVSEYSVTAPAVADAQVCPGGTTTLNAGSYTSYSWSNGSTSQTNTVGVGSYSVTVTDSNGCTATDAASVTEYSVTAPAVADAQVCPGSTTTLNAGSYTSYSWSNGSTSQTITVGAGSYSVTVTDSNGCTATDAASVTEYSVTAPAVADAQVCPGGTTTLDAGSYASYSWSNGATSQTNTVGVGSYSVTVTDSNGCTATDAANVSEYSVTAPAVADAQVCPGGTTTLNAGSYTSYSWSNGSTSQTNTVGAGSYSVTVTDSNGCTATDAANVTEYSVTAPAVADAQVCPGGTTTLNAGSYTSYSWSNGSTSQTNTVGVGSYSVTVTDSNGCTATDAASVSEYSVTAPAVADAQVCPWRDDDIECG
jgi:hypothetical protein